MGNALPKKYKCILAKNAFIVDADVNAVGIGDSDEVS